MVTDAYPAVFPAIAKTLPKLILPPLRLQVVDMDMGALGEGGGDHADVMTVFDHRIALFHG